REGLEGDAAEIDAIAELAEDLRGAGIVIGARRAAEEGRSDGAPRLDIVPGVARAGAQGERAPLPAAIEAEMIIVALARGEPAVDVERAAAVAGDDAEAQVVEGGRIGAEQEAAGGARQRRSVAVAGAAAPGTIALAPDRETFGLRQGRHRPLHAGR